MSPEMLEPPFEEEEVYARADKVDSYALPLFCGNVWNGEFPGVGQKFHHVNW